MPRKKTVAQNDNAETDATSNTTSDAPSPTVTIDWDDFEESSADFVRIKRVDVEKETPERIKEWLKTSFRNWDPENPSSNRLQIPFPTKEIATEFIRLARRYCNGRADEHGQITDQSRWTFRGNMIEGGNTVIFSVRPYEKRERKAKSVTPEVEETASAETTGF